MPCRCDYMEPSTRERQLQETAKLLVWIKARLKRGLPTDDMRNAANDSYCKRDYVPQLCEVIDSMSIEEKETYMYDGHNSHARKLANWWEVHEEADRLRLQKISEAELQRKAKAFALSKLTIEDQKALGLIK